MSQDGVSIALDRDRLMMTVGRFVAGLLLLLGIVAVLRTKGQGGTWALAIFTVHPLTALVWAALGLVGVAMSTSIERTRRYLTGAGGSSWRGRCSAFCSTAGRRTCSCGTAT